MPLVTTGDMLCAAQAGNYAVAAFNVENMEMLQGVIEAACEQRAPVLLQTTGSTLKYASPSLFRSMAHALTADLDIPVALHLDHGSSVDICRQAMSAGYTSVMIDGSRLPLQDNAALTAQVVALAAPLGISVEAELGTVGGKEDEHEADNAFTDPEVAKIFVEETGIASLAVAIGTSHGFYKGEPRLDFERLERIRGVTSVPLVLHGASGLSDEAVRRSVSLGICKINFATELRDVYTRAVRGTLQEAAVFDPKQYGMAGRRAVAALAAHKMAVCGCAGRI